MAVAVDAVTRVARTAPNLSAPFDRTAEASTWLDSSTGGVRSGVLPGASPAALSFNAGTNTWTVGPFSAVLDDGSGGALQITNKNSKSESVTRPSSGTSRFDVIALVPSLTGTDQTVNLTCYSGTASASPSISTALSLIPANGLYLTGYQISGTAGAAVTPVTTLPKRTVAAGGICPVADAADLATLAMFKGAQAYREDNDAYYRCNGAAWSPISLKTLDFATATTNVQSGSAGPKTITGMTRTVQIGATTDVLFVYVEIDFSPAGSVIAGLQLQVDGANYGTQYVYNNAARLPLPRTVRVTGLSPGSHIISATINWGAGAALDIIGGQGTTSMTVEQRAS